MSMRQSSFWCGTVKCGDRRVEHIMDPSDEFAIFKQPPTRFNCVLLIDQTGRNSPISSIASLKFKESISLPGGLAIVVMDDDAVVEVRRESVESR
jgi:hypothetical protein